MSNDTTTRVMRLGKYQYARPVRFIRPIVLIWFGLMILVTSTIVLTMQSTANLDYSIAHSFKPVH